MQVKFPPLRFFILLFGVLLFCLLSVPAKSQDMELVSRLLTEIPSGKEDTTQVQRLQMLTWEYQFIDLDSARYWGERATLLASKVGHPKFIGLAHYKLGNVLSELGELELASEHGIIALAASRKANFPTLECGVSDLLGVIYSRMGLPEKALEYLQSSIVVARRMGDNVGVAFSAANIGNLYFGEYELEKALEYFELALQMFRLQKDSAQMGICYQNIALLVDSGKVLTYLDSALLCATRFGSPGTLANIISNLGSHYFEKGEYERALVYFDSARTIYEGIDLRFSLPGSYNALSETYLNLGQIDSAELLARKAMRMAKSFDSPEEYGDALYMLYELQLNKARYDSALHYVQLHQALKDSLFTAERSENVARMEARFEVAQTQEALARKELELSEERNTRNLIILGSLVALVLVLLAYTRFRYQQQEKRRQSAFELQKTEQERQKLQEINELKSTFFANISHEFRTPLTLLLSPLRAMQSGTLKGNREVYLRGMIRNAERLMGLINQLLEMARLEKGELQLVCTDRNLISDLQVMALSFQSLAEDHQIEYQIALPEGEYWAHYDREKLEQVLVNLLSNAFKYTPDGRKITVKAHFKSEVFYLEVIDQGKGIPAADLAHIFDRFYRVEQTAHQNNSTGLGLALVKELVELMQGEIRVTSDLERGSRFLVSLPMPRVAAGTSEKAPQASSVATSEGARLLVIEDHPEVVAFLKEQLQEEYQVLTASNGQEGLELAIAEVPNLVLTDVMMPEMNGIELCQHLKKTPETSHIPVVMLTALSDQNRKLEGLEAEADHYLSKPFDLAELRLILRNQLEHQKRLSEHLRENGVWSISKMDLPSMEKVFLEKVLAEIERRLTDDELSVEGLALEVGMSRSQLHRKLKALTGKTPSQFIRSLRLNHARQLLEQRAANVSEAAYLSGFNSPAYFTRCFTEEFGVNPSQL